MSALLDRYASQAVDLRPKRKGWKTIGYFEHPDFRELMGQEMRGWAPRMRELRGSYTPTAALGFAAPFIPNGEPITPPTAITLSTSEQNLWGTTVGSTTSNTSWCLVPPGQLRVAQALRVIACGIFSTTTAGTTINWTSRFGTSTTPTSNGTLGATGAMNANGSATITNGLWWYEAHATVRTLGAGTNGTLVSHAIMQMTTTAGGTWTSPGVIAGMSGNSTATFDATLQTAYTISVTGSAAAGSVQLTQFMLAAWD